MKADGFCFFVSFYRRLSAFIGGEKYKAKGTLPNGFSIHLPAF
jgi:hypothetical protein